ncbi:hypothetical protein [Rhodoferax ferrireducens]|uniref:hypothetical protein n=1 Tax=Rhodoferax ferrireducens TaxID=192843 RepID=UPI0013002AAD|nr:hypothetical protein [Rhodoferax ferrireducens]
MGTENIDPTGLGKPDTPSFGAIARRRILLQGVGKGAAVLAATVPIQTLAGQSLLTFDGKHQCSVSGMTSGVHSKTPTNTPVCGGYSPGWWGQSMTVSGKLVPKRTWPALPKFWTYKTKCSTVFTKRTLTGNPTLFEVMNPPNFANTDEFHWICAWLNALSTSFNFPYTGQQVLDFYNSTSSTVYEDALAFFKTYMETHAP